MYSRQDGHQGRSGRVRKISPPTGIRSPDRTTVASRYTDWAIPAHFLGVYLLNWSRYCLLLANTNSHFHHTHRSSKIGPLLSHLSLIHVLDPIFLRHWANINPPKFVFKSAASLLVKSPHDYTSYSFLKFVLQSPPFSPSQHYCRCSALLNTEDRADRHTQRCAHLEQVLCFGAKFKFRASCNAISLHRSESCKPTRMKK